MMKNRPTSHFRPGLATSMTLLLTLIAPSLGAQHPSRSDVELQPGVVISERGDRVFLANERGHLEAISLASGELRWTLGDGEYKPLVFTGQTLLVHEAVDASGSLPLLLVDGDSGRVLRRQSVELPVGVRAGVVDHLGGGFNVEPVGSMAAGPFDVAWSYERQAVAGATIAVTPEKTELSGMLRIDPAAGAETFARHINAPTDQRRAPEAASIELAAASRLARVEGRQFRSIDARHVMASTRVADHQQWQRYRWQIMDTGGQRLGEIAAPMSYSPFTVADGLVLYTMAPVSRRIDGQLVDQPAMLHAVDLSSGTVQWQRAILDHAYRGPFPP